MVGLLCGDVVMSKKEIDRGGGCGMCVCVCVCACVCVCVCV